MLLLQIMLELNTFNCLEKNKQFDYLWSNGIFIALRAEKECDIALYYLRSFYAEIKYDSLNNTIKDIRSFQDPSLADAYFSDHLNLVKSWL